MSVQPTQPGSHGRPGPERAQRKLAAGPSSRSPREGVPASWSADRVEISEDARRLSGTHEANGRVSEQLTSARLGQILGRIGEGYYDRPEILHAVARRLAHGFGLE